MCELPLASGLFDIQLQPMREINAPSNKSANPWLLVCAAIGAFMAAYVVYDLTSSASDADALTAAKAKASSRERDLQRQVDHLRKALGESDGRLTSANLKIQELLIERKRRKEADEAHNNNPGSTVSATSVKALAGSTPNHSRRNDLLIADAVKDFYNGRLHAAKFKLEEIVMNNPTDVVAREVLVIVTRGVLDADAAWMTRERTAGGR
jgi:hypothetical protein